VNRLDTMDRRFTKIEGDLKRLIWMVGFTLAPTVAVIFTLLRH